MQYETKYRVLRTNGEIVEAEYIQTKGDDEKWPTFRLADGSLLGVSREKVLGEVTDDCPPEGIVRGPISKG